LFPEAAKGGQSFLRGTGISAPRQLLARFPRTVLIPKPSPTISFASPAVSIRSKDSEALFLAMRFTGSDADGADHPGHDHDIHATLLHQLGIDHERLSVRHNGLDRRLTDVHGHVIREMLA
jgi:hypothetical protein